MKNDVSFCIYLQSIILPITPCNKWAGSSVGIATDYGLEGPGTESRWGDIFGPPRRALEPTQPPVQCVPGLSRG